MNELVLAVMLNVPPGMAAIDMFDRYCPGWNQPPYYQERASMRLYLTSDGEGVFIPANAPVMKMRCNFPLPNNVLVGYTLPTTRVDGTPLLPEEITDTEVCAKGRVRAGEWSGWTVDECVAK